MEEKELRKRTRILAVFILFGWVLFLAYLVWAVVYTWGN